MTDPVTRDRGVRKERRGVVVSKSGDKSVVVLVERRKHHPLYGKTLRVSKKLHAHDEGNQARAGDTVTIVEMRPKSRMKRWRVTGVVGEGTA